MVQKISRLALKFRHLTDYRQYWLGVGITAMEYLLFPAIAWLALWGLAFLFATFANRPINLIETFFLPLLTIFLIYRIIALLINSLVGQEVYLVLVSRFLLPLFLTYVVIQFLGLFSDLSLLGNTQLFTVAKTTITLRSLFIVSVGLYFWFAGINGLAQFLRKLMLERLKIEEGTLDASLILLRYFLIGLGLFIAFNELNLDSTAIAAVSGGLAVGIGFGLKDIVVNFISGIILLFERSISPGDIIEFNDLVGRVEEINLRATTIKTDNEIELVIPNQLFLTDTLKTYTRRSRRVRFDFPIPISCEYNPEIVIKIILEAVHQDSSILISLTSTVEIEELGDSIIYNIGVWTNEHLDVSTIRSNLYRRILVALASYGIEPTSSIVDTEDLYSSKKQFTDKYLDELNSYKSSLKNDRFVKKEAASQIELVESSFEKIKPYANEFVTSFYQHLFQENPKLRVLFRNTDMNKMYQKLLNSLVLLVESLRNPNALQPVLKNLGAKHKGYGVIDEHYPAVCAALMATFPKYIPTDWTPEVQHAWASTFQAVTQIMQEGAAEVD